MSALTVWKFETVEGAGAALSKLEDLSKQQLITIEDAAVVYWEQGKKKPKTHQAQSLTGVGALGGAFWGMLFGLLFFMPFFGMAVGAAIGALAGHYSDYGIDEQLHQGGAVRGHQRNLSPVPAYQRCHGGQGGGRLRGHAYGADPLQPDGRAGSQTARRFRRIESRLKVGFFTIQEVSWSRTDFQVTGH